MQGPSQRPRGRLRLHFSRLKHQPQQLAAVVAGLRAVPGVAAAEGTPFAGSVLIRYDSASGDTARFWDDIGSVLAAHGLQPDLRPLAPGARPSDPGRGHGAAAAAPAIAAALVDRLAEKITERLTERCALALFAALF